MIRIEVGSKQGKNTNRYIDILLRCIQSRKNTLLFHHHKTPHKFSFEHRVANDQSLSMLYIEAEKELSKMYSITYSDDGRLQVTKNLI